MTEQNTDMPNATDEHPSRAGGQAPSWGLDQADPVYEILEESGSAPELCSDKAVEVDFPEDDEEAAAPLHADPFVEAADASFSELGLINPLVQALQRLDIHHPSPVQAQAIPVLLSGSDLVASAPTGTGKTAAFLLPALQGIALSEKQADTDHSVSAAADDDVRGGRRGKGRRPTRPAFGPSVLVLTPTRELAQQVTRTSHALSRLLTRTSTVCITGGASYFQQAKALSMPYEVLVATPGRLIDQLDSGKIDLSHVRMLVLDEADRMLDMGFSDDVFRIADLLPASRQTVCFTATISHDVRHLADRLLKDPQWLTVERSEEALTPIDDHVVYVDNPGHRGQLLRACLNDSGLGQAIVFTATKRQAEELAEDLLGEGFAVDALHGDMNQRERTRALNRLRQGECQILIATDVAARGIDVSSLTHVINHELPRVAEDYVHRIGRTGRAGASGQAISFVGREDVIPLRKIEHFLGRHIQVSEFPGLEAQFKPAPARKKGKKKEGRRDGQGWSRGAGSRDSRDRSHRAGGRPRPDQGYAHGHGDRRRGDEHSGRHDPSRFAAGAGESAARRSFHHRDGARHTGRDDWSPRIRRDEERSFRRGGDGYGSDKGRPMGEGTRHGHEGARARPTHRMDERRPFDRERKADRGFDERNRGHERGSRRAVGVAGDRGERRERVAGDWKPRRDRSQGTDRSSGDAHSSPRARKPWSEGARPGSSGRGGPRFGQRHDGAPWQGRDARRGTARPDNRDGRLGDRNGRMMGGRRGGTPLDPDRAFRSSPDEGRGE